MPFATAPDEFMRTTPPKIFTSSLPGYSYPAAAFMIRSCWYRHVPGSGLPVPAQALIPTPHAGSAGMEARPPNLLLQVGPGNEAISGVAWCTAVLEIRSLQPGDPVLVHGRQF